MNLHTAGVGGDFALTFFDDLVVDAVLELVQALGLGNLLHVGFVLLLPGAIDFFHLSLLDFHLLGAGSGLRLFHGHQAAFFERTANESGHEVLQADGLCAVFAKDFIVDAFDHLLANLLAKLDTGLGNLLLVVTGVCASVQALYEFADVGAVDTDAGQVVPQALCL